MQSVGVYRILKGFQMTSILPSEALMKNQKAFCVLNIVFLLLTYSQFKFLAVYLYMEMKDKEWHFHIMVLFLVASTLYQIHMQLLNLISV